MFSTKRSDGGNLVWAVNYIRLAFVCAAKLACNEPFVASPDRTGVLGAETTVGSGLISTITRAAFMDVA